MNKNNHINTLAASKKYSVHYECADVIIVSINCLFPAQNDKEKSNIKMLASPFLCFA